MKIYNFETVENVYLIGDIHGEFRKLLYVLKTQLTKSNKLEISSDIDKKFNYQRIFYKRKNNEITSINNSLFFIAGDCGFGFNKDSYYKNELIKLNNFLNENNIHIIFIRGNHDDPRFFNEEILDFSNLICIPDYSVVKTKNLTTLCVGGGLSIDRTYRIEQEKLINRYKKEGHEKHLYWKDEMPIFKLDELNNLKKENIEIDSVITHTAPSFADPKIKATSIDWFNIDKDLKNDAKLERQVMDDIFNYIQENQIHLKFWAYGHFHIHNVKKHYDTLFIALNKEIDIVNPFFEIKRYEIMFNSKKKPNNRWINPIDNHFIPITQMPINSLIVEEDNENNQNENNNHYGHIHFDEILEDLMYDHNPF